MNGEGCLIKVPLKLKPSRLNELLVFRLMGNIRYLPGDIGASDPFKIDVKIAVRAGKQAGRFRRGMLAQHDGQGDGDDNQHHAKKDGESTSYAHELDRRDARPTTIREQ